MPCRDQITPALLAPRLLHTALDVRLNRGDRSIALVRFVCLERAPTDTWQERFEAWNECEPEQAFASARAFHAAFRRAETQLTGKRGGLAWFFNPAVQFEYMSLSEIGERARSGDEQALEHLRTSRIASTAYRAAAPAFQTWIGTILAGVEGAVSEENASEDADSVA